MESREVDLSQTLKQALDSIGPVVDRHKLFTNSSFMNREIQELSKFHLLNGL